MARVGRPRKPTALKIAGGNPGKRALPKNEPTPVVSAPRPPSFLTPVARAEWRRMVKELGALKMLARVDRAAMAGYCMAWSDFVLAREHLLTDADYIQETSGGMAASVWLRMSNEASKQIRQYTSEFGLSPSARVGLSSTVPVADDDEAFLNESRKAI